MKICGKICAKQIYSVKTRENRHHHWILHIRINLSTKFQLKLKFLVFSTKFAKKGHLRSSKIKHHHWILHIRISLGTKFQIKLKILIFWTKLVQKLCIYGQHRKMWRPPLHYAYSYTLSTEFHSTQIILNFGIKYGKSGYFQSKTRNWTDHWILHIRVSLGTNFSLNWPFWTFQTTFVQKRSLWT